jgi:copper chaperone CopZ
MKKNIAILVLLLMSLSTYAQKLDTLKIHTSAQCEMCKERIEKAMAYERGVKTSELDLESKILTVMYKSRKTGPEKIREAVSMVGYDADDVKANERVYSKLPACCKKPDDPDYEEM